MAIVVMISLNYSVYSVFFYHCMVNKDYHQYLMKKKHCCDDGALRFSL